MGKTFENQIFYLSIGKTFEDADANPAPQQRLYFSDAYLDVVI